MSVSILRNKTNAFFFSLKKIMLFLQALKHNALLEGIRMFLFWEGKTAENLDKNHQAEEESLKLRVVQVG